MYREKQIKFPDLKLAEYCKVWDKLKDLEFQLKFVLLKRFFKIN